MSHNSVDPSILGHAPPALPFDFDNSEADDEVDQLDSDSDIDDDVLGTSASGAGSKKSPSSKKTGERVPGQTLLPTARLENIMQADGVTGSLSMSKEAQFLLSIATEEFIKRMAQAGQRQASTDRRSLVNYRDMASTTQQYQEFMFLQDTIPYPISITEALQRREDKEKEIFDVNPTLPPNPNLSSISISAPSHNSKSKGKSRVTNGKEKQLNGNSTASRRESRRRDSQGRRSQGNGQEDEEPRANSATGSRSSRRSRDEWGEEAPATEPGNAPTGYQRWTTIPSQVLHAGFRHAGYEDGTEQDNAHPLQLEGGPPHLHPDWTGRFTGPASAFLQDPRAPFSRVPQNPGRTIYSHRTDPR